MQKVLFARVGWMRYYAGPQPDDLKPVGGGRHNHKGLGGEAWTFLPRPDGRVYSYFQPFYRKGMDMDEMRIDLDRISPKSAGDKVSGVLIVFFATHPTKRGQSIIGWYSDAVVSSGLRYLKRGWASHPHERHFFADAPIASSVLLPEDERNLPIVERGKKKKKGRPGQTNVFYVLDKNHQPRTGRGSAWIEKALAYVNSYDGPNLLSPESRSARLEQEAAQAAEEESGRSGQGFATNSAERTAIDKRAMRVAEGYLQKKFRHVKDVSKRRPYDFECRGKFSEVRVEVKGTRAPAFEKIFLTSGEVKSAGSNGTALLLVSGIKLTWVSPKAVKASGGKVAFTNPWKPKKTSLKPLSYQYTLP